MKPYLHAKSSARKFGGEAEDYVAIHDFMDYSKAFRADVRHRAALHHALGCWIVEEKFGHVMTNSAGKTFAPRDVAEQHCVEDHGTILSLRQWLKGLSIPAEMEDALKALSARVHVREGFLKVLLKPVDFYPGTMISYALYHTDYGIWLVRELMGEEEAVKAQEWIVRHFGFIPAFEDVTKEQEIQPWMGPPKSTKQSVTIDSLGALESGTRSVRKGLAQALNTREEMSLETFKTNLHNARMKIHAAFSSPPLPEEKYEEAILAALGTGSCRATDLLERIMLAYSLNTLEVGRVRKKIDEMAMRGILWYDNDAHLLIAPSRAMKGE